MFRAGNGVEHIFSFVSSEARYFASPIHHNVFISNVVTISCHFLIIIHSRLEL